MRVIAVNKPYIDPDKELSWGDTLIFIVEGETTDEEAIRKVVDTLPQIPSKVMESVKERYPEPNFKGYYVSVVHTDNKEKGVHMIRGRAQIVYFDSSARDDDPHV